MPRLIDADELLETLRKDPLYNLVEQYNISGVIESRPIVDAVEVVRCKDCQAYRYSHVWNRWYCSIGQNNRATKENDYCSWGERREKCAN